MGNILLKILRWLISLFSWLTLSPLFYYLTWKWNLIGKKLRIVLLFISPMFGILYITLFALGVDTYYSYHRKYRFADKVVLGKITEIAYPDFKIIEYTKGRTSFLGDYNDELIIEFEQVPSAMFYQSIDSIIAIRNDGWFIHDSIYSYNRTWGNGFSAPKGEDDEEDMMFSIRFKKGSKQAIINYGAW